MIRKQTKLWTRADGTRLRICDMKDSHLLSAIRCVEEWARREHARAESAAWAVYMTLQGEIATWSMEQEIDRLEYEGWDGMLIEEHPTYGALLMERDRRKFLRQDTLRELAHTMRHIHGTK